jgi:hypothetical protein
MMGEVTPCVPIGPWYGFTLLRVVSYVRPPGLKRAIFTVYSQIWVKTAFFHSGVLFFTVPVARNRIKKRVIFHHNSCRQDDPVFTGFLSLLIYQAPTRMRAL